MNTIWVTGWREWKREKLKKFSSLSSIFQVKDFLYQIPRISCPFSGSKPPCAFHPWDECSPPSFPIFSQGHYQNRSTPAFGWWQKGRGPASPGPTGKAPHDPVVYNLTLWSTIKVPMTEKRLNSLHPTIHRENANILLLQFILKEICKATCLRFMVWHPEISCTVFLIYEPQFS